MFVFVTSGKKMHLFDKSQKTLPIYTITMYDFMHLYNYQQIMSKLRFSLNFRKSM